MVKQITQRKSFTMIELIFALVIISITVMSLPTVLLMSGNAQEQTLKEEGIMLTSTKVAQVLTYPWDQNSAPDAIMSTSQALNTGGDGDLGRNGATDFRVGHFPGEMRRRLTPNSNARNASAIGGAAGTNMGAFDGTNVQIGAANATQGYKKVYRLTTAVTYIGDGANYNTPANTNIAYDFNSTDIGGGGGTTNVKMVEVTTEEQDPTGAWIEIIKLSSFSSNIGEAEFFKRRY